MRQSIICMAVVMFFLLVGCAATSKMSRNTYPLSIGVDELSAELIRSTDIQQAGKVAVLYFIGPQGKVTKIGEHLSDKLNVRLFQSRVFGGMMERKQLRQVLAAKKEELSGYFDPGTVHQFGRMIGVDSVIIGKVEDLGRQIDVTAKVISSESGKILGMADVSINKDEALNRLLVPLTATVTIQTRPPVDGEVIAGRRRVSLQNGTAILTDLSYGDLQFTINAPGYEPVCKSISVSSAHQTLGIPMAEKRFSVSFQVLPPDAMLRVDGKPVHLGEDGFARINNVVPCEHSLFASAKGYESKSMRFNPVESAFLKIDLYSDDPYHSVKDKIFKKYQEAKKKQAFKIELWTDKKVYHLNEPIVFNFRAQRSCYLNLVDINSRGEVTLLFPNSFHRGNYIQAQRTYRIPDDSYGFRLEVQPPTGRERVYAIASYHPIDIFDTDFKAEAFSTLTRGITPEANVRGIGVKIDDTKVASSDELVLEVVP